jgi:phosphatidylglycerophosphatase A
MSIGLKKFVATAGGIGYLPWAPGTWAAAATSIAWLFIFNISGINFIFQIFIFLFVFIAGTYFSGKIIDNIDKDPSHIVIDEVAGMCLTFLFITPTFQNILVGFFLFRFFDIAKPFGIRSMEKISGGWGIMLDDILAGIYSNIILRLLIVTQLW